MAKEKPLRQAQDKPPTLEELADKSILERIKTVVHPADDIARTLQVEHEATERIRRLMALRHAALLELEALAVQAVTGAVELADIAIQSVTTLTELSEDASQAVIDSGDALDAQTNQVSNQQVSMAAMAKFADKNADARQLAETQDVWLSKDDVSIRHILEIVNLSSVTKAARPMKRHRVVEIIDALLKAVE